MRVSGSKREKQIEMRVALRDVYKNRKAVP
jgi:hypothetical protein